MSTSHTDNDPDRDRPAEAPGTQIPRRPTDTTAAGDAKNDTGEDNQQQKGERPASDYVRR